MKKFFTLALLAILFFLPSFAQKSAGTVKGILQDSATAQPLQEATVSVTGVKDSAVISFTRSSGSGYFEIKSLDTGSYHLLISHQSFEAVKKEFSISADNPIA
ncbi:MAG: carboxypeptidase-like regulatory domain-containing protein, partial [Bacteroidota bacterium]|nr:carboxypeptidase-like regulatory domain-containing protein [Bacteroidota bacterium]